MEEQLTEGGDKRASSHINSSKEESKETHKTDAEKKPDDKAQ